MHCHLRKLIHEQGTMTLNKVEPALDTSRSAVDFKKWEIRGRLRISKRIKECYAK